MKGLQSAVDPLIGSIWSPRVPIHDVYLLVHPYYSTDGMPNPYMREIWVKSIQDAAKDEGTFGVLCLEGYHESKKKLDESDVTAPTGQALRDFKGEFHKHFGEKRSKIVIASLLNNPDVHSDKRLEARLVDRASVRVSARGEYGDICVEDAIKGFSERYDIPYHNCSIIKDECVWLKSPQ